MCMRANKQTQRLSVFFMSCVVKCGKFWLSFHHVRAEFAVRAAFFGHLAFADCWLKTVESVKEVLTATHCRPTPNEMYSSAELNHSVDIAAKRRVWNRCVYAHCSAYLVFACRHELPNRDNKLRVFLWVVRGKHERRRNVRSLTKEREPVSTTTISCTDNSNLDGIFLWTFGICRLLDRSNLGGKSQNYFSGKWPCACCPDLILTR